MYLVSWGFDLEAKIYINFKWRASTIQSWFHLTSSFSLLTRLMSSFSHSHPIRVCVTAKAIEIWGIRNTSLYKSTQKSPFLDSATPRSTIPKCSAPFFVAFGPLSRPLSERKGLNAHKWNHPLHIIPGYTCVCCSTVCGVFWTKTK